MLMDTSSSYKNTLLYLIQYIKFTFYQQTVIALHINKKGDTNIIPNYIHNNVCLGVCIVFYSSKNTHHRYDRRDENVKLAPSNRHPSPSV